MRKAKPQIWKVTVGISLSLVAGLLFVASYSSPKSAKSTRMVSFAITYRFFLSGITPRINFVCLVPKTLKDRQEIIDVNYSTPPLKVYDVGANRYAEFTFLDSLDDFQLTVSVKAKLLRYDLGSALRNRKQEHHMNLGEYLKEERYLKFANLAGLAPPQAFVAKSELATIENIYYYVLSKIEYTGYNKSDLGAEQALRLQGGDCTEYSDVFVSLCRAQGIPARVAEGYSVDYIDTPKHSWAEVYLRGYGWVPFDPTLEDSKPASFNFYKLQPVYLYLSNIRNDEFLHNYHYYLCRYRGGPVRVVDSFSVEEPSSLMADVSDSR